MGERQNALANKVDLQAGFRETDIDVSASAENWKLAQDLDRRAKAANEMVPRRLRFTQASHRIKNAFSMAVLMSTVLEAESGEELRDVIAAFDDGETMFTMYSSSAKSVGKSLKTTTTAAKRHFGDRGARAKAAEAAKETAAVRAARAKAAASVKLAEQVAPPVYTLGEGKKLPAAPEVDSLRSPTFDILYPAVFVNVDGLAEWSVNPKVQLALADFGGLFKKTTAYKDTGVYQEAIKRTEHKEIYDFLTKATAPLQLKLEKEEGDSDQIPEVPQVAKNVLGQMWFVGADAKRRQSGSVRNGFGQFRVQCGCPVRLIVFSLSRLAELLGDIKLSEYVRSAEMISDETVHEVVLHQANHQKYNQINIF